jgi:hypothetical protein
LKLIIKIWQLGFYFLSEPGEFGPIFFYEKFLCIVGRWKSDFSGQKFGEVSPKKEKRKKKKTLARRPPFNSTTELGFGKPYVLALLSFFLCVCVGECVLICVFLCSLVVCVRVMITTAKKNHGRRKHLLPEKKIFPR